MRRRYSEKILYASFPKETVQSRNSKGELTSEKDASFRPASELLGAKRRGRVYTIGYEGRTIEDFVDELVDHDIARLVDVRELPLSRKKGFSKKPLERELKLAGIEYLSLASLGAPRDLRCGLRSNLLSFFDFAELYRKYLEKRVEDVKALEVYVSAKTSALMCFEADWRRCHRSIIAEFLERDGFEVIHL